MSGPSRADKPKRLLSLDAYRGFIMLVMASSGFAFAKVADNPKVVEQLAETEYGDAWYALWQTLAYQFSHVQWSGCSFWDLIQPSFMFMVGVAMPYSFSRRRDQGQSWLRRFGHVLFRSIVLVLLAVFLSSNSQRHHQTNFVFTNVLAQIGLGYTFVYLLLGRRVLVQLLAAAAILGGYWYYFYQYTIPANELRAVAEYLHEFHQKSETEYSQFTGLPSHWNKHTNAAAEFDREFLNSFPREGDDWNGKKYWISTGGYHTLNFVPSMATMIFGLMAGQVLRSRRDERQKFSWLILAGCLCFVVSMAVDTNIWPAKIQTWTGCRWSLCPTVKRIWTPSWALFSAGWTFWMLAAFYWIIDVKGWRRWSFPLVVVGMNSIAMYCMSQLIKPWAGRSLATHLASLDQLAGWDKGIAYYLFSDGFPYAQIGEYTARLFVLWLICLWLYRKKIFIRI